MKGLPSWPGTPRYEQLEQGDALRTGNVDLESYWNGWQPVAQRQLVAGQDFDQLVFAISIGAVPYLCQELLAAQPAWQTMVDKVTTVQTQTMQIWMNRTTTELGWDIPFQNPTDTVIGATYLNPLDGQVDFTHLLQWEDWPANAAPKSLWYFSGAMAEYEAPPPFTDTGYPARAHARVQAQCVQYLQASIGPLLPLATTNVISPPGDPVGLDFSVLHTDAGTQALGVQRFNQQFWRANIDPTESYVTSPPGSTAARIKAWDTGFSNLVIAGDWIYTGLNVGSVEGAVMGGKLASFAVSGYPLLKDIVGFPLSQGPQKVLQLPSEPHTMKTQIDHLVVVAHTLDQGVQWCEATLGITPAPGGEHAQFGTHNRLVQDRHAGVPAWRTCEIIAIQPGAKGPANPNAKRWFDMDNPALRAAVAQEPRLVHFVANTDEILAARIALKSLGIDRGPAMPASRHSRKGVLQWQITVREDGQRLFDGALPTLIQWGKADEAEPLRLHPRNSLPRSGVSLQSITITHPTAAKLQAAYDAIGLSDVTVTEGAANITGHAENSQGLGGTAQRRHLSHDVSCHPSD